MSCLRASSYPTFINARPLQPLVQWRDNSGASLERPLVIARGPDGRFEGMELGNLNWDYARDLLDAVTPLPAPDETVRLWYRTHRRMVRVGLFVRRGLHAFSTGQQVVARRPGRALWRRGHPGNVRLTAHPGLRPGDAASRPDAIPLGHVRARPSGEGRAALRAHASRRPRLRRSEASPGSRDRSTGPSRRSARETH